jgi:hypothetical protein
MSEQLTILFALLLFVAVYSLTSLLLDLLYWWKNWGYHRWKWKREGKKSMTWEEATRRRRR